ncbi:hypothetical protein BU17DRAFT_87480 [Hysterangium stoloniferum]|nr:hypothetical protein BU17DRAFT_87480 [Hysterangium stoloniferum]
MPKASTEKSTKASTKAANAKTAKPLKEEKAKRPPSAYNVFMKDRLTTYKADHPELNHKEAFTAVAALWKDAPENPNRGKEAGSKKKTAEGKENVASKPKRGAKKAKPVEQSEEEDADEESDE